MNKDYKFFKYNGQRFCINTMSLKNSSKGWRIKRNGIIFCVINCNLNQNEKSKILHRLIKCRGLKLIN